VKSVKEIPDVATIPSTALCGVLKRRSLLPGSSELGHGPAFPFSHDFKKTVVNSQESEIDVTLSVVPSLGTEMAQALLCAAQRTE